MCLSHIDPCVTQKVQIHVDRYKFMVYRHLETETYMKAIITRDETSTRFHACERFDRCKQVEVDGHDSRTSAGVHVVYVNPVTMGASAWEEYQKQTKTRMQKGEEINNLVSSFTSLLLAFAE